jgi:hypothetical protein
MIKLHGQAEATWDADAIVVRLTTNAKLPEPLRSSEALLINEPSAQEPPPGFRAYLSTANGSPSSSTPSDRILSLPHDLDYLKDGDIIRLTPRKGRVRVMYRRDSRFNYMLLTEQLQRNCVMCSQRPKTPMTASSGRILAGDPVDDRATPQLYYRRRTDAAR